jgi:hypothetical protein
MAEEPSNFKYFLKTISKTVWLCIGSGIVLLVVVVAAIVYISKGNSFSIHRNENINITPSQVNAIKNIGEWEFLSISDEELIDTVRQGFFGDSELVRIYYGTLRLGVDMHEVKPGWIKIKKENIVVALPPIKLLDDDFIDEARTVSFYEKGDWSEKDRSALYQKAYWAMKSRCMNQQNISSAEQNASKQFYHMMRLMGFQNVNISFDHN